MPWTRMQQQCHTWEGSPWWLHHIIRCIWWYDEVTNILYITSTRRRSCSSKSWCNYWQTCWKTALEHFIKWCLLSQLLCWISHYVQNEIMWPLCCGLQLWWTFPAVPKESHPIWASIQQKAHRPDAIHDPQSKFPYSIPLETWNATFCDQKRPRGSDNAPNVQHCWSWTTLKRGENRGGRGTMMVGGNYFLIEAYVTNVTYKLTIVKESGCGASHCVFRVVFFVYMSVFSEMFTQHWLWSSETRTIARIVPVELYQAKNSKLHKSWSAD